MAKHFVVAVDADTSHLTEADAPVSSPLEPAGWDITTADASGVSMVILTAEPGAADFDMHASPDAWLAHVVEGRCKLVHGASDGSPIGTVDVAAGDYITFEPNAQHAWQASDQRVKMLFVKRG
ncbi:MAG: cupin domain-containing protein [Planctomycetota bacterium]